MRCVPAPGAPRSRRFATAAAIVCAAVTSCTAAAHAGTCGDDVESRRVACACGDVVVSNVVLRPTDPVVRSRCMLDGLIVRAAGTADSITVDLGGQSIVGRGYGTGIRVEGGGSEGAVIVGGSGGTRGAVVGFGTGILSARAPELRRVERVDVRGSRHDGLFIRGAGTFLVGVHARANAGNGIHYSGTGGRLLDVEASENGKSGIVIASDRTSVEARVEHNARDGVVCTGSGNDLSAVEALGNARYGLLVRGRNNSVAGVRAENNGKKDISLPQRRAGP